MIDKPSGATEFAGLPVVTEIPGTKDVYAVIICAINNSQPAYDDAYANFPMKRVLVFEFPSISNVWESELGEMR